MPAPKTLDPYESPVAFFGAALRRHWHRLGLTQAQLGKRLSYSEDTVSKFETGESVPTVEFGAACDAEFGTHEEMTYLARLARRAPALPAWLRPWVEAEREARTLRSWEPLIVPGLLQTEAYARALLARRPGVTERQVEERGAARMERQRILEGDDPPVPWVVLDEGVLHRDGGGPPVMREQLHALLHAARRPHVTVHVVPAGAAVTGLTGAFAIAAPREGPDTVYLESACEGQVTDRPDDVRAVGDMWEAIRATALPDDASLDVITKVMEQWT